MALIVDMGQIVTGHAAVELGELGDNIRLATLIDIIDCGMDLTDAVGAGTEPF